MKDENMLVKSEGCELGMVCAVWATNRQAIIDNIHSFIRQSILDKVTEPYLHIELECGNSVDYKTEADVPYESVPCPCGNPKHWLIKYEEALNAV